MQTEKALSVTDWDDYQQIITADQFQQFKYVLYDQFDTLQIYFKTVYKLHNCVLPLVTNNIEMCQRETQINN